MNSTSAVLQLLPRIDLCGFIALIGLCIGSFLNVVCYRLAIKLHYQTRPKTIHLLLSRSFCPQCHHFIAWYNNIPLLSFCLQKGRCRHCHRVISWRYPAIELLTACLSLSIFMCYGLSLQTLGATVICWWLIPLAILDFDYFILPNELTFSLIAVGLVFNCFNVFSTFSEAIIGAIAGYLVLALIDSAYYLWRKQHGIGQGDWKLFAALGACFGWQGLIPLLLLASASATVVGLSLMLKKRATLQSELPFGVFLSLAGILGLFIDLPQLFAKLYF